MNKQNKQIWYDYKPYEILKHSKHTSKPLFSGNFGPVISPDHISFNGKHYRSRITNFIWSRCGFNRTMPRKSYAWICCKCDLMTWSSYAEMMSTGHRDGVIRHDLIFAAILKANKAHDIDQHFRVAIHMRSNSVQ